MIGLGVGIDYALFIVVRYRTGLHDGLDPETANILALTTAGRAVLFAGCTVIISLLGMFVMGINFIYGLSLGAILAVLMVMLASVTWCRRSWVSPAPSWPPRNTTAPPP